MLAEQQNYTEPVHAAKFGEWDTVQEFSENTASICYELAQKAYRFDLKFLGYLLMMAASDAETKNVHRPG